MTLVEDLRNRIKEGIEISKIAQKEAYKSTDRAYVQGALFTFNVILDWLPKETD